MHASETHGIRAARVEDRVRDGDNPAFPPGLARACLPGAACRGRHGQRQQQHPAQHRDSDKAAAGFPDAAFGGERFDDLVQHAVDEGAAAGCRVVFRNLDVLVERYFDGNRRERGQFGHGCADDQVVHEHDAFHVPVGGELFDVILVGIVVDQRFFEKRLHEFGVFVALELRGDFQFGVRRFQARERTQDHHYDVGQVVAPEDRHLFQLGFQRLAALQLLEEIFEQLAVVGERALLAQHVVLEIVAFRELRVERTDQLRMSSPAQLAGGDAVVHGIAVGDDAGHPVVYELGIGVEVFVCRQFFLFGQFLPLLGITRQLHGEGQDLEIEVVGLVDGRHQRFSDAIMLSAPDLRWANSALTTFIRSNLLLNISV